MENLYLFLTMAAIGGIIGYSTNKVAVKMLFRPHRAINFGFFKIQGVLPKRQSDIAKSVSEMIETALLNEDDLFDKIFTESSRTYLKDTIAQAISKKIHRFIPSMFRTMLGGDIDHLVDNFIEQEGDALINTLINHIKEASKEEFRIADLIEERINALDLSEFESMVKTLTKRELRHIETIGLILGTLIGVTQYFITSFL